MQTFIPYQDFIQSAKCLDYRRLGKQRVEAKQIIDAIEGRSDGWKNHPCTLMWKDYVDTLKLYHDIMIAEWIHRGYKNNMPMFCGKNLEGTLLSTYYQYLGTFDIPNWLTDEFCSRHRAALLAKDYEYYSQFGWTEEPKIDYIWGKRYN